MNYAPLAVLRRVSGLNEAVAKSIVKRREEKGAFANREELKQVRGLGERTFRLCAGFVRIFAEEGETER